MALRVERRLGRIHILRHIAALVVVRLQRARGEGDYLAAFVRDGKRNALAEARVHWPRRAIHLVLRAEQPARPHHTSSGKMSFQGIPHGIEIVRRVADAEGLNGLRRDAAPGQVFPRACSFRRPMMRLRSTLRRRLVDVQQLPPQASLPRLFGRRKLALRQRDPGLLRHCPDRLGEAEAVHLHHEVEDVALLVAAKTVVVAMRGVDRERACLLLVERAQPGKVLRARLAQLQVIPTMRTISTCCFTIWAKSSAMGLQSTSVDEARNWALFCAPGYLSVLDST